MRCLIGIGGAFLSRRENREMPFVAWHEMEKTDDV